MEGKKKQKKKKKKEKNIMKKWNEKRKQREDALGVGGSRVSVRVQKRTYVRPGVKFWTYTKFLSTITPGVGLLSFSTIHNHDSIINTRILQFQGQTLRQRQQQNTNAPAYVIDLCQPVSNARGSRFLRSAERGFWWSRLPVQRPCRTAHSLWRALRFGMISLRSCASCPLS